MVRFLNSPALADDHSIIALMVFQVIMVLAVSQGDVALSRQQVFLTAVFIDHIAAIVSLVVVLPVLCTVRSFVPSAAYM